MALFKWKEYYSVNIDSIDLQHKRLVTLVNNLHKEINDGFDEENVQDLIFKFIDSTKHHFESEEDLLKENNYGLYKVHKREHDKIIDAVEEFNSLLNKDKDQAAETLNDLIDSLKQHFLEMDRQYSPYLTARGVC